MAAKFYGDASMSHWIMAVYLLGTTRVIWSNFFLKTSNILTLPAWSEAEPVWICSTLSPIQRYILLWDLLFSLQLQKFFITSKTDWWERSSEFLYFFASTKPSKIGWEWRAEPFPEDEVLKPGALVHRWACLSTTLYSLTFLVPQNVLPRKNNKWGTWRR